MGAISDWIQNYGLELGSFLVQLATLATVVWFGRKALGILAAAPRIAEAARPQPAEPTPIRESGEFHGGLRGLIPMEQEAEHATVYAVASSPAGVDPLQAMVRWLNTPWKGDGSVAWRRVSRQVS